MTDAVETTPKAEKPKAAKKAAAKKAAKDVAAKAKKAVKTAVDKAKKPRGNKYELTDKGKKLGAEDLSPQEKVLHGLLAKKPMTTSELAAVPGIKEKLGTTSDPIKPISFYVARWKKGGHARFAKAPKA